MKDINNIGVEKGKVKIIDFQHDWADIFNKEKIYLSKILRIKKNNIFHIGSTAIPNCKAKPIIDIAIPYKRLFDSFAHQKILMSTEYANSSIYYLPDRICYTKGVPQKFHLYLIDQDSPTLLNWILFQEILMMDAELRKEYCELKLELANKFSEDRIKYTKGKTEFIISTLNKSELWQARILEMKS